MAPYGPHRVYTGHWFLTPQCAWRPDQAVVVASGRMPTAEPIALVDG
jgi:hypothetical protein